MRRAAARFIAWRVEAHLQAIDPAGLEALQHAAQQFAAFWRRCDLRAREIGARCAAASACHSRGRRSRFVSAQLGKAQLRFCLRATVNALLAFGVTHMLAVPLHGQWAVLTAVAVIQMSIGGSLKAAAEYIIGTICGALYATAVAALVPPSTELSFALALALAIGPLAYAAAISPSLRVAPVTAVLVLMISTKLGETPIGLAYDRLLEVAIGLLVAITVSFLVLPAPAHTLGLESAARALELMARALPEVIAGFADRLSPLQNLRLQDEVGEAVRSFAEVAAEAKGERIANLAPDPDPAVLARTLRRLRHDLVMLGRAAAEPLPARRRAAAAAVAGRGRRERTRLSARERGRAHRAPRGADERLGRRRARRLSRGSRIDAPERSADRGFPWPSASASSRSDSRCSSCSRISSSLRTALRMGRAIRAGAARPATSPCALACGAPRAQSQLR